MRTIACILLALAATVPALSATTRGAVGAARESSLLQTWDKELSGTDTQVNPILRVVGLLKDMQSTLQKEMDEDEALYKKLACWCNTGSSEKSDQISDSEAKINELTATIESLTARQSELSTKIKELEAEVAANKEELATAKALRAKQLKEAHGAELDSIQAIENLKAALVVLTKHTGEKSTNWHEFLQLTTARRSQKDEPWLSALKQDQKEQSFESFLRTSNFDESDVVVPPTPKFLQQETGSTQQAVDDTAVVKRAMKSMSAFLQAHHELEGPSYSSQSGEIVGIMKQMKETMESDLKAAQKLEHERAATFEELRSAKTQEIEEGEKMAEQKEDELATTSMDLAEAKEDLEQTSTALGAFQEFLKNLESTCKTADADFDARKKARMDEINAVSQTIEILTADEARDAANGTYFLQTSSSVSNKQRKRAAALLRRTALKTRSPELAFLATSVELDAFTKVKKAIDDMVAVLQTQQADEVKKNDWCKDELQSNEMNTLKKEDEKADLEAKNENLASSIKTLAAEIEAALAAIAQAQLDLQRASENRKAENMDFQTTVADQTTTREVLEKALDKLANFYDKEELLQKHKQTPPVPQAEYAPSAGATGVMSMIEKLIHETKQITAASKKAEGEAQKAYETLIADTNAAIKDLMAEVSTKTENRAQAKKDKTNAESDLADAVSALEGLAALNADLHSECDYVLKNFEVRQQARAAEIASLQEAKAILSGASA